jgi:hypothetical protein
MKCAMTSAPVLLPAFEVEFVPEPGKELGSARDEVAAVADMAPLEEAEIVDDGEDMYKIDVEAAEDIGPLLLDRAELAEGDKEVTEVPEDVET